MLPEPYQFRDIHAALGDPWWPPAPGWWLILAVLVLLALAWWRFDLLWRLRVPIPMITLGSWRWDAGRELRRLRRDAGTAPVKRTASQLSELLRRIAMARNGRGACAGLHGTDWLAWLAEHDPKGFDWSTQGRLLLDAPYAPPAAVAADRTALLQLVDRAMDWVVASDPKPARSGLVHRSRPQPSFAPAGIGAWVQAGLARLARSRRAPADGKPNDAKASDG